jgi:hypothetical protein
MPTAMPTVTANVRTAARENLSHSEDMADSITDSHISERPIALLWKLTADG